ncbi:MAG: protease pro-enzyme activation domain-containing protein, partial [Ktedonobacteraceae bacterium]
MLAQTAVNQQISLAVGLSLRNQAGLASYLQQITTPHSPIYHHYLNAATFAALYGPLPSSEAAVISYLRSQGFTITATYPNHLVVDARGTVALAEQAFQTQINNYQAADGQHFFANAGAPSLPSTMGPLVASVVGLDNLVQYGRVPLSHGQAKPGLAPAHNAPADITCPQPGPTTVPT